MIFFSREDLGDEDAKEIVLISSSMGLVLQDKYYNVNKNEEKYMVQTRLQTKTSVAQLPEVHGSRKRLDPHKIPEKQPQPIMGLGVERNPRLGQGRAGVRRKALPPLDPRQGTSASKPIIISNGIGPKMPKSIMEILRGEMLPPYLVPQTRTPKTPR